MGLLGKNKGKYVKIDKNSPSALGVCDESGFTFNRKDLHKQMAWRGNSLVWTGFYVGTPYLDVPSQQDRPPPPDLNDPLPVKDARLPVPYTEPGTNPVLPTNELTQKLSKVHWGV